MLIIKWKFKKILSNAKYVRYAEKFLKINFFHDEAATVLCLDCYFYFCEACFKFIRDRKKNNGHKKEKIDLIKILIKYLIKKLKVNGKSNRMRRK